MSRPIPSPIHLAQIEETLEVRIEAHEAIVQQGQSPEQARAVQEKMNTLLDYWDFRRVGPHPMIQAINQALWRSSNGNR